MMRISDLLQFSLRKLCCIHVSSSARQVMRVHWVAAERVLVERRERKGDLSVIGVAVKTETMLAEDLTEWENVDNEK